MTTFLLEHGSYFALTLVLVATGFGLPVPEEVPVVVAGVLASHQQMHPWLALGACLVGVLIGDCAIYTIGRRFGRNLVMSHPYWARLVKPEREAQLEEMIQRHGLKTMFLARFLIVLRTPVYLTAGILRMPFWRFLLIDVWCATVVVGTVFLLSYNYGETITRWVRNAQIFVTAAVALAAAAVVVYLWRRHRRRRALKASSGAEAAASGPVNDDERAREEVEDEPEQPV